MKALIDRFSCSVKGVLSGFDRIVFKGWILPLMSASQVTSFLRSKGVLNKDYKDWMIARKKDIVNTADQKAVVDFVALIQSVRTKSCFLRCPIPHT